MAVPRDILAYLLVCPNSVLRWFGLLFFTACPVFALASPPPSAQPKPVAQIHLASIERTYRPPSSSPVPGAAVRSFQEPDDLSGSMETFEIHWFANAPGLPSPGLLLFEYAQERSSAILNRTWPIPAKTQGHFRSIVEISSNDIQRAGKVRQWRASVVWRGRVLARRYSDNWEM